MFKRTLFGYRPSDVDAAIDGLRTMLSQRSTELAGALAQAAAEAARVRELERVADLLAERVVDREHESRAVREELARMREDEDQRTSALAALAVELEQVRAQARRQATRMRMIALREAAALSTRIDQIARDPGHAREDLLEALSEALDRIEKRSPTEVEIAKPPQPTADRLSEDADANSKRASMREGPVADLFRSTTAPD